MSDADTDSSSSTSFFDRRKLAGAVLGVLLIGVFLMPTITAEHAPADKIAVSGSTLEVLETQAGPGGSSSGEITLLSGTMKTSSPTDLLIEVNTECALYTDIKTKGNDEARSAAQVIVWVEIDGQPVPVSGDDDGTLVFCQRDFAMRTSDFADENATIELFLDTRATHGFEWFHLDAGSGEHTIEVKATLDVIVEGKGTAKALIGKRTMSVQPVKLANDATI